MKIKPRLRFYCVLSARITKAMKTTPTTIVRFEITFSAPRSFEFENKSKLELPEKAPVNPSDFPLCNNDRIIKSTEHINNRILIIISTSSMHYLRMQINIVYYTLKSAPYTSGFN